MYWIFVAQLRTKLGDPLLNFHTIFDISCLYFGDPTLKV